MNKGNPQIQGKRRFQDKGFPLGIEIESRLEQVRKPKERFFQDEIDRITEISERIKELC